MASPTDLPAAVRGLLNEWRKRHRMGPLWDPELRDLEARILTFVEGLACGRDAAGRSADRATEQSDRWMQRVAAAESTARRLQVALKDVVAGWDTPQALHIAREALTDRNTKE